MPSEKWQTRNFLDLLDKSEALTPRARKVCEGFTRPQFCRRVAKNKTLKKAQGLCVGPKGVDHTPNTSCCVARQ
jgi:hypothetical protein